HLLEAAEVVAHLAVRIVAEELRRRSAQRPARRVVDQIHPHHSAAAGTGGYELHLASGLHRAARLRAPGDDAPGLIALDRGCPLGGGAERPLGDPARAAVLQRLDALDMRQDIRQLLEVAPA